MDVFTCIWFDDEALEAAEFWCSVLDDARITNVSHYPDESPFPPGDEASGKVLTVDLELAGHHVQLLNGGPVFPLSEVVSLVAGVDGQAELDRVWDGLLAGGGSESQCGWLKDRFGVSWQVVPVQMVPLMTGEAAGRVSQALMGTRRIDIAALEAAARG